jgi:hypothetical protein
MKGPWRFLLLLVVISPFAFLFAAGFFEREDPRPRPSPRARPAAFRVCQEVSVEGLPKGLVLVERDLRNLGQNVMGRSIQYSGGVRRVWVGVGYEVLEGLEDLDFTQETTSEVRGRQVRISATDILSGHRLRAGVWGDERFQSPCDEFTVVTWNLSAKEFLNVLRGIEVVSPDSQHGGIG